MRVCGDRSCDDAHCIDVGGLEVIRRLIARFVREEDGIVLVIAIATMAILAITTSGVIVSGTANESTAFVSLKERAAFAVAQQALAYGEGMVYGDVEGSPSTSPPTGIQGLPTQPDGATGTYYASTTDGLTWTVVGIGTVGSVTRTVSADVTPFQTVTTTNSTDIWSYGIYEDDPVGSLTNCPVTGNVVVSLPIFARGDFCQSSGTSKILGSLEVGGSLLTTGGAQIGTASSPISKLRIAGMCDVNNGSTYVTPGVSPCDGTQNYTFAAYVANSLDTIPAFPVVDFAGAYATQAALAKTGCPANLFDNDSTMNNSDTSISSVMFGSTAYDCVVGTNEIKWDPSTSPKSLTVKGTLYFDGSLTTPAGNPAIVYSGGASMYFTGGVSFGGDSSFCGIAGCSLSWDTSKNIIIMVADCVGLAPPATCVNITGGKNHSTAVQFGVYATGNYSVSGGATNPGHILCWDATVSGSSTITVSMNYLPPGTPTSTGTTTVAGSAPKNWSG
jgi:Tfp pilus assembly protein PilX